MARTCRLARSSSPLVHRRFQDLSLHGYEGRLSINMVGRRTETCEDTITKDLGERSAGKGGNAPGEDRTTEARAVHGSQVGMGESSAARAKRCTSLEGMLEDADMSAASDVSSEN